MATKITPFIRFESQAKEAAEFYCSVFPDSAIKSTNPVVTEFTLLGNHALGGINGGPMFKPNPSISFSVRLKDKELTKTIRDKLVEGGTVMMEFGEYSWSEVYGRCSDRYGVSRQIMYDSRPDHAAAIVPSLMYTGDVAGKAEEAMTLYTQLFENSSIDFVSRYGAGEQDVEGTIAHAEFTLENQVFIAMDSSLDHKFSFSEGVSLSVSCKDQAEVDYFRDKMTADGGSESQCGWCKDKYGVSRQIIPVQLQEALYQSDKAKADYAMQAMMKMSKIVIKDLYETA